MVISDDSLYQGESSPSSRRTRNARRSFDDYVCDGDDNNTSADITDDDDDFRPTSKTSSRRKTSKRNTKKSTASSPSTITTTPKAQANGVTETFPVKLHRMLEGNTANGLEHIASWQPHGRCFVVHKQQEFVDLVMPDYFQQSKYPSFQRQLNLYGFKRITKGPDRNGYHHPSFLRGYPELSDTMVRMKVKGTGVRRPHRPEEEPDFYKYPDLPAAGNGTKKTTCTKSITKTCKKSTKQPQPKLRRSGPGLKLIKASSTGRGKVLSSKHSDNNAEEKEMGQRNCHRSPNRIVTPPISPEGAYDRPQVDIMDVLDNALLIGSADSEDTGRCNQQIYLPLPEPPLAASIQLQNQQQLDEVDHSKMEFEAWPTSVMSNPPITTLAESDSDVCYFFGRPFHYLEAMHA